LCGTKDYAICYQGKLGGDSELNVHGFVDTDWAGDLDQRRSTNGYVFKMFGGAINWMSKRHAVIALSTIEDEYMETTHGSKEEVWIKGCVQELRFEQRAMKISCDSQSTIFLEKNPSYHSKTKHIDV
jgi:hypothetical protein